MAESHTRMNLPIEMLGFLVNDNRSVKSTGDERVGSSLRRRIERGQHGTAE